MGKKRIGLDVDGCLYQWERTARYMLRKIYPGRIKDPFLLAFESNRWDYIPESVGEDAWNWLWTKGVKLGLFRYGHLYPGAIEAVRRLSELGDVVLITNRPRSATQDTYDWASYLRLPISEIHFCRDGRPKSDVKPLCDAYLDDRPENCVDLWQNTLGIVKLMSQPWNAAHPAKLERVADLAAFVKEVEAL